MSEVAEKSTIRSIQVVGGKFFIRFPFANHLVNAVKAIPGRRWDAVKKAWTAPASSRDEVMKFKDDYKFIMDQEAAKLEEQAEFVIPPLPDLAAPIPLLRPLYPFQEKGVAYMIEKKRCMNGDQMGCGKTSQAIAAVVAQNAYPCLVICPSTLKTNWEREFMMVAGVKAMVLYDGIKTNFHRYYDAGLAKVFIVNYESLKKYFVEKIEVPEGKKLTLNHIHFKQNINFPKSIIIDESHKVKSSKTLQAKLCRGIASKKEIVYLLTGTPVMNKPSDLWSQLHIMDRLGDFGGYTNFINTYCAGAREASNLPELNFRLNATCFFARKKSDVLTDLPEKTRQVVSCKIDEKHWAEYTVADQDLRKYLEEFKNYDNESLERAMRGEMMVRIGKLKDISARGKMSDVFEFIEDVLENGEKMILFAHHHVIIDQLSERYPDAGRVTGRETLEQRQASIDKFQNDPECKLIFCGIQAGGVGITLTAASQVAFIELGWTAAAHDQCEDRAHRIGVKSNVQCTYFIGKDTIDEYIYNLIEKKRDIAAKITGSSEEIEVDMIKDIFNLLKNRK